jgi:hypothetical protein
LTSHHPSKRRSAHYFRPPLIASKDDSHVEKWVVYSTGYIAAKELTVLPGKTARIKDVAAYGCIITQGHGRIGSYDASVASMMRYGELSSDEYFVSEQSARDGVEFINPSRTEPLVLLKHFGPNAGDPALG